MDERVESSKSSKSSSKRCMQQQQHQATRKGREREELHFKTRSHVNMSDEAPTHVRELREGHEGIQIIITQSKITDHHSSIRLSASSYRSKNGMENVQ